MRAAALARYAWPGNVREVANLLEHAVVVSRSDEVRLEDLPDRLAAADARLPLEEVECRHIEHVLADSTTLEKAAMQLGISSTTPRRKR